MIVELVAATTTQTGLPILAEWDQGHYPTGTEISNATLAALPLTAHDWHPDWNYNLTTTHTHAESEQQPSSSHTLPYTRPVTEAKPFEAADYAGKIGPSRASADVVLPLVFDLLGVPSSVLDVGCGAGAWLAACAELGVADLAGIEGGHPSDADLQVSPDVIRRFDLCEPADLGRRFDLTISVEVAEHIPAERTGAYLRTLTAHSEALLFSAAVPSQGGVHHVNEQWPAYWYERLVTEGFECFDPLRSSLWADERVRWWYRQNMLLYARGSVQARLKAGGCQPGPPLALVHPCLYESKLVRRSRQAATSVSGSGPELRAE